MTVGPFDSFHISASALTAERLRMDTLANNLANVNTTRTETGGPFRRQLVIFQERAPRFRGGQGAAGGVRVVGIVDDPSPLRRVYDPGHPDADAEGYVHYPNVNVVTEMVDLVVASRAYEANLTAFQTAKELFVRTLELLR